MIRKPWGHKFSGFVVAEMGYVIKRPLRSLQSDAIDMFMTTEAELRFIITVIKNFNRITRKSWTVDRIQVKVCIYESCNEKSNDTVVSS